MHRRLLRRIRAKLYPETLQSAVQSTVLLIIDLPDLMVVHNKQTISTRFRHRKVNLKCMS